VPGTRWGLVTRQRWDVIVRPVHRYNLLLSLFLLAGAAASALLVFISIGKVLRPVRELSEGARRIAAGDFRHTIAASTGDEIEELARQFNTMARSLKDLYAGLEEKVDSRTREVLEQQRRLAVVEERSRVARDLHDSVSQSLYSVTLFAEAARRQLAAGNGEPTAESLRQLGRAAGQALKEMRLMVFQLRPSELHRQGLIGALRQRLNAVEKRAGIEATMEAPEQFELPEALEVDLFSIAQEALNNALKHSGAGSAEVSVRSRGGVLELTVRDDGAGFESGEAGSAGGMGLLGMRERAEKLGAKLTLISSPGKGTEVKVEVEMR